MLTLYNYKRDTIFNQFWRTDYHGIGIIYNQQENSEIFLKI